MSEALVYRLTVPAPVERVFARFTDPALMAEWIGVDVALDARPGGALRIDVNGRDVVHGTFVELDPPARLSFTWGWEGEGHPVPPGSSLVEVTLAPCAEGTSLELRHTELPAGARAIHREGWDHYLPRLTAAVEGRTLDPDQKADAHSRHGR